MWCAGLVAMFLLQAASLVNSRVSASSAGMLSSSNTVDQEGRCEVITIPMCVGIGYNLTRMPNDLNHENQEEAGLEVHQFWPLVEIKCSPDLLFFLCSMYAPICLKDYSESLPPCRDICERSRNGCEPIMQHYGFKWPDRMECDKFPVYGSKKLCMGQPSNDSNSSRPAKTTTVRPKSTKGGNKCRDPKNCRIVLGEDGTSTSSGGNGRDIQPAECQCRCLSPLVPLAPNPRNISAGGVENCAHPCRETYFNSEEKEFAAVWTTLWSGLCAASTLMTLTTFLIETERFKYPERPIVFLSACYFLVSIGYLIRIGVGHEEVACDGNIIRYSSTGSSTCTLVFLLVYFFGMASSIWWVILSFTWFLAAGLKWGNEAITSYSHLFHLAAWLIPTVQTVAVLLSGAVDGDPVSGICYVGNMNMDNLRTYVLAPLVVYLLVGTTFLFAGFVSLFRIRSVIKKQGGTGAGSKADKLEKLMIRIGIFSVLYTVPATIVIGCHLYESKYHHEWLASMACPCHNGILATTLTQRSREVMVEGLKPLYSVLMLKYFMALAVGITSGVWIWSGKTVDSWRRLYRRIFNISHHRPDPSGAGAVLIKTRPPTATGACKNPIPPQYLAGPGSASLLGTGGLVGGPGSSVASASQHHIHHHMMKQPPLTHV